MSDPVSARSENLLPVRSRVSWGAVFAGAVVALALYFLLTLIGGAVGLSVSGHVRPSSVGMGAAVWVILSTAAALFVGGLVTSQLTAGENKVEAVLHGIILWGVLFAVLLWLMSSGVKAGFNAMVGMAHDGGAATPGSTAEGWEVGARRAGISQATIDKWRDKAAAPSAPEAAGAAESTESPQVAAEAATRITWWAVLGTILSMSAAVAGSVAGSGPAFRLFAVNGLSFQQRPLGRNQPARRDWVAAQHHDHGEHEEAKKHAASADGNSDHGHKQS
jgi:hypothetical protein